MPIEALLFDLGKVIVDFDFEMGMNRFAAHSPLPREEFVSIVLAREWVQRYEKGIISTAEYHEYLRREGKLEMDIEQFHETWSAVFLPELIVPEKLLSALGERYPMILVSNTNECHARHIADNYPIFDYFDHCILSHEVGSLKPERRIYEAAIAAAGKPPESLFFTDDREENIEMALKLGIRAHRFESLDSLLKALKNHEVEFGDFVPA